MTKSNETNLKTNVNEELLEFFKYSYFGNLKDPIEAASNRAYRDMCRTLDFEDIDENDKKNFKKEVKAIFKNIMKNKDKNQNIKNIKNQDEFDIWHHRICNNIIEKSEKIEKIKKNNEGKEEKIQFTYGQAQKWVNMTIKYLYMLEVEEYSFDNVIKWLHIPIDNYIFKAVKDKLKIKKPTKKSWSRWDNYDEYLKYQNDIRERIEKDINIDVPPLLWEFNNWLEVAKGNNKN